MSAFTIKHVYSFQFWLYNILDETRQQADDCGPLPSWDGESAFAGQFDDGDAYSDVEDPNTLVSQPRQVGL
jgi:condensin complex subunit 2